MKKITKTPRLTTVDDLVLLSELVESSIEFYTNTECTNCFDTDWSIVSSGEIRFNLYFDISNQYSSIVTEELFKRIREVFKDWIETVPSTEKNLEFRVDF